MATREPIARPARLSGMRRPAIACTALLVAILALAGCASVTTGGSTPGAGGPSAAGSAPPGAPTPSVGASTGPAPSPATSAPTVGTSGPVAKGSPVGPISGGEETLSGTVSQGAEPSCLILRQDAKQYELLLPGELKVTAGESVTVTGHEVHGIMSHCMQGTPFQVDTLTSTS